MQGISYAAAARHGNQKRITEDPETDRDRKVFSTRLERQKNEIDGCYWSRGWVDFMETGTVVALSRELKPNRKCRLFQKS